MCFSGSPGRAHNHTFDLGLVLSVMPWFLSISAVSVKSTPNGWKSLYFTPKCHIRHSYKSSASYSWYPSPVPPLHHHSLLKKLQLWQSSGTSQPHGSVRCCTQINTVAHYRFHTPQWQVKSLSSWAKKWCLQYVLCEEPKRRASPEIRCLIKLAFLW